MKLESAKNEKRSDEKRILEEALAEKDRVVNQIHESIIVLRTENEVNGRMVQSLMDKLAEVSIASLGGGASR
ncbi:hypothetical protein CRE_10336 [Caenorhabditis remanei]|uniref:Uncharacterized protein n=1 Tax=Caenorhabditis remanei TaxID=31234 RepID=E3MQF5_CAERE|nr:hypothetical protein CRE_10336 [Caenorhabditis remanei]